MKLRRIKQFKWCGQLNPYLYFFCCFIRLLHGAAILIASVTWYFKMNGELLHMDTRQLPITFPSSPTPLLPTVSPVGPRHFAVLVVGLPEQLFTMGTPTLDTSMVSPRMMCKPYPNLVWLLSPQTNPATFSSSTSSKDLQQAEWCRTRAQVLLLGVSLGTSPIITPSPSGWVGYPHMG